MESFDLRLSNQYIFVRVIPWFRFAKNVFVPNKFPVKVQPEILDIFCSFFEPVAGSLSVASTAVSANVAVDDSGEVDRSAVYSKYNNGPRTLPWGMPAFTRESSVYSVSTFYLLCK
jgi:hypothetical protein